MPMKKKSAPRRRRAVRRAPARRQRRVRNSNVSDFASCSSKITITAPGGANFASNNMYSAMSVQLADYARPLTISKGYQHYRIKNVRVTFKFPYDTFQSGVGGASRPNFYYMIDKSGSIPVGINLDGLKAMGARPRQVDERPITVGWTPSVLTVDETLAGPLPAQYKISPWLSTDVPNVAHLGLYWYVDQMFGGGTQYQAEIEVQFQFKKPLWNAVSTITAQPCVPAVRDDSPDGIVGGGDENNNPSWALAGRA